MARLKSRERRTPRNLYYTREIKAPYIVKYLKLLNYDFPNKYDLQQHVQLVYRNKLCNLFFKISILLALY